MPISHIDGINRSVPNSPAQLPPCKRARLFMSNTTSASSVRYFGIEPGPALYLRAMLAKEIGPMRIRDQVDAVKGLTREFRRWTPQSKRTIRNVKAQASRDPNR
jgi:hypothetical protein